MGAFSIDIFTLDGGHGIVPLPKTTMSGLWNLFTAGSAENTMQSMPFGPRPKWHGPLNISSSPRSEQIPFRADIVPGLGPAHNRPGSRPRPGPGQNGMDLIVFSELQALNKFPVQS
jgi:hypothetical protein